MSRLAALPPVALAALCGAVLALPFRDFDTSIPAWFALAPVLWLVACAKTRRLATAYAGVFSLTWTAGAFAFLWSLAPAAFIALSLYTSLFYMGALLAIRWMVLRSAGRCVFGVAAIWTLVEILRSVIPVLGFPWLLLGHTLLGSMYLRQGADLLGAFGLSFLIATANAWLALGLSRLIPKLRPAFAEPAATYVRRSALVLAALLTCATVYGIARVEQLAPKLVEGPPIATIQGNIAQKLGRTYEQCAAQLAGHLEMHREIVARAKAGATEMPVLICWAETMVPGAMNIHEFGQTFKRQVAQSGIPTLAGSDFTIPGQPGDTSDGTLSFNTAYLIDQNGNEVYRYAKRKLVAFGEYIPFTRSLPFMRILRSITRDQYRPGEEPSRVLTVPSSPAESPVPYHISLSLCVEDIHPDLAREAAQNGADTLVNLTNDGWFYGNFGAQAHLRAAAWRSIEVRRPMLRVTNTGRTVAIDPLGSVTLLVPESVSGTAVTRLKRVRDEAPWTLSASVGEWGPALLFGLIALYSGFRKAPAA